MKILFILILSTFNMMSINFETFLGKDISIISFMGDAKNNLEKNTYIISEPQIQFLEKNIEQIVIGTNENKTINRIIIFLEEPIDTFFYKVISDEYGDNYNVMVIDKVLQNKSSSSSEIIDGTFKETLKQTRMTLKKGSINDIPKNNILWNKDNYNIILYYNYNKNKMDVHFVNK